MLLVKAFEDIVVRVGLKTGLVKSLIATAACLLVGLIENLLLIEVVLRGISFPG